MSGGLCPDTVCKPNLLHVWIFLAVDWWSRCYSMAKSSSSRSRFLYIV